MRSLVNWVKTCRYFHNLKQSNLYICFVINHLQMRLKSLASYLQFFLQKQPFLSLNKHLFYNSHEAIILGGIKFGELSDSLVELGDVLISSL